jgi:hypothetical protein
MLKKIAAILNGSEFYAEDDNGGYARVGQTERHLTEDGVEGGEYRIAYGRQTMPPHGSEEIAENEIEVKMREHQPDLRKWSWLGG